MKSKTIYISFMLLFVTGFFSCSKSPDIDNETMLDGDLIFDPSLYNPQGYLVSAAIDKPTDEQLMQPVIIVGHGYTASTFEWDEFRIYCEEKSEVLISQVLLGGHGRTYEEFKHSTWEDWQTPIITEYEALKAKGYKNISFAGSSTSCPLIINLIKNGVIEDKGLKHVFLIDPIVVSSDKLLTIVGALGPMLGYLETTMTNGEVGHWYHFRPQETLQQLMDLIDLTRKDLEKGIQLPNSTHLKVYKSVKDPTADAVSAVLIYKGLSNSDGSAVDVEMLDSELHVLTRLNGRENVTQHDRDIQAQVFDDMYKQLLGQ